MTDDVYVQNPKYHAAIFVPFSIGLFPKLPVIFYNVVEVVQRKHYW